MAPMERPASAAMGQAVAAREASEGELLTQARSLSYRLRLVRDSLERLRPSSELLIGKRGENLPSALAAERLTQMQLDGATELVYTLGQQLRAVNAKLAHVTTRAYAADVPVHPTRYDMSKLLRSDGVCMEFPLNLSALDLSHIELKAAALAPATKLARASLEGCQLSDANLSHTSMPGASLSFAVGVRTMLTGADCAGADLSHAKLTGASLASADLSHANLVGADLSGSDLRAARLEAASLAFANLSDCDLTGVSLAGSKLTGVRGLPSCVIDNLRSADLTAFDLSDLDLSGVDLTDAVFDSTLHIDRATLDNLRGARLFGCDLSGVELGGVDLSGAHVEGASFAGAVVSSPAQMTGVSGLETFPLGSRTSVQAGSVVAFDGFLLAVSGDHPANPAYAYYVTHDNNWAQLNMSGCFEKSQCRLLG